MSVRTNTRELRDARRTIIELILANHPRACQTCIRNERCNLQALCREYSIEKIRYEGERRHTTSTPRRSPSLAILTSASLRQVCEGLPGGAGRLCPRFRQARFSRRRLPPFDRDLADTVCVLCGQCLLKCPVAAIRDKSYIGRSPTPWRIPQKIVTVQIAPSVRRRRLASCSSCRPAFR